MLVILISTVCFLALQQKSGWSQKRICKSSVQKLKITGIVVKEMCFFWPSESSRATGKILN